MWFHVLLIECDGSKFVHVLDVSSIEMIPRERMGRSVWSPTTQLLASCTINTDNQVDSEICPVGAFEGDFAVAESQEIQKRTTLLGMSYAVEL